MSNLEANKQVVRDFIAGLGRGDVEAMKQVMDRSILAVAKGTSSLSGTRDYDTIVGTAGMLNQVTKNGIAFDILSMTAEDDRVSAEVTGQSELVNGTPYNNSYHFLATIRDGKIVQLNEYFCTKLAEETVGRMAMAAAEG